MLRVGIYLFSLILISTTLAEECASCCNSGSSRGTRSSSVNIDYVQLAVQSAKGFCEMKNCDTSFSGWSIHGLWPSQKGSMGPNSCNTTSQFNVNMISSIQDEMNKKWPTLLDNDPTGFWCHEWCKHGTCAVAGLEEVTSMISYFTSALGLFTQTNMNEVFRQNGIVSSTEKTYQLSDFQNLFSPSPAFECTHYKGDSSGQLLYSARFCYTTDLQPAQCNMDWFVSLEPCKEDVPIYYL